MPTRTVSELWAGEDVGLLLLLLLLLLDVRSRAAASWPRPTRVLARDPPALTCTHTLNTDSGEGVAHVKTNGSNLLMMPPKQVQ
jgi:hypothetical protein